MTYQALARKWRPQRFAELVGQEAIVTALGNALREGRIAQAYLFSGIRGVGKTTAARVLAKALNCVGADGSATAPAAEPCNECPVCVEITQGGDLDVLEIDAATYSKVEQVRDLTESLKYGPARDRYKVVVLDEIHRLSRQAFDALLKIVEEPPAHLTFVFATTEIEMVPATILSRCQEFHFRRVAAREMVAHLTRICEAEEIEASQATLHLIARASEGSVRDAVALLDQLATFGDGKLADEDVGRLLGGIDTELLSTLLTAILGGDGAQVSRTIRSIEDGGTDPRQVFTHFLGFLRSALHLAQGLDPEQADLPVEAAKELARVAADAGYENLLRLLHLLLSSETVVRRADAPGLALEVALLRAAELPRLVRIEQLGATLPDALPAAPDPTAPPGTPGQDPLVASGAGGPADAAGADDEIQRVLAANHPSLAGLLDFHKARFAVQGSTLVITAVPALEEALRDASKAAQLKDAARAVLGPDADWKTTGAAPGAREDAPSPAGHAPRTSPPGPARETASGRPPRRSQGSRSPQPSEKARRTAEENPTVRAVLDIFGGRVVDVRPRTH
ncbi:MAG: DNA polymerase III subunit gamma/tau [Acidobacteria bacterium]|nr:DNA polymerase III subunit gamma/tau [Acidobacteriota bacterium]